MKRIFNGYGSKGNWLHGFWSGLGGMAYSDDSPNGGWRTIKANAIQNMSTNWLVFCSQNAPPDKVYANGQSVGISSTSTRISQFEIGVNDQTIGQYGAEKSDFAIMEVTVWSRALSEVEIQTVSSLYMGILDGRYLICTSCKPGIYLPSSGCVEDFVTRN
jgi:hypothetical protein